MTRKLCSLFITALLFLSLNAEVQNTVSIKSAKAQTYSYTIGNSLFYFIRDGKVLHVLLYDTALTLIKSTDFDLADFIHKNDAVVSVSQIGGRPALLFSNQNTTHFTGLLLDKTTFNLQQFDFPKIPDDEIYLNNFSWNDRLFLIFVKYSSSLLQIVEVTPDHPFNYQPIASSGLHAAQDSSSVFSMLVDIASSHSKLQKIRSDQPKNNALASSKAKLYCSDSSITITLDADITATQIERIDLATFNTTYNEVKYSFPFLSAHEKLWSNSFLLSNNLFHITASNERLFLDINDATNGSLLKHFITDQDEAINYKSSAFIKETADNSEELPIDAKKFLKKLHPFNQSSYLSIGVYQNSDNQIEACIGSVIFEQQNIYYFNPFISPPVFCPHMIPMPMPIVTTGFHWLLPALIWHEGFSNPTAYNSNLYFRAVFNKSDLSPVGQLNSTSKMTHLMDKVKVLSRDENIKGLNAIIFNQRMVIAFFESESKVFKLTPLSDN